jgi:hypothetical protein
MSIPQREKSQKTNGEKGSNPRLARDKRIAPTTGPNDRSQKCYPAGTRQQVFAAGLGSK